MTYKEIKGDLFAHLEEFDVIAQGNNCFCVQASGIAPIFVRKFSTDQYPMEAQWTAGYYNKMGQIDYRFHSRDGKLRLRAYKSKEAPLAVVNCYTQYSTGFHHLDDTKPPIDYEALTICMRKIAQEFEGKRIGLPAIGAGLAGGNWKRIKKIFKQEVASRCDLTVVLFKP